jgi:hypothetical protein
MIGSDIGIDLGTASILVYIKGKGVVLKEPSVVAFDRDTNKIKAIGEEARLMIGRTPGNIVAVRPLRRASSPIALIFLVSTSKATTEGSFNTTPLPFTYTKILAVPKSIPISVAIRNLLSLQTPQLLSQILIPTLIENQYQNRISMSNTDTLVTIINETSQISNSFL